MTEKLICVDCPINDECITYKIVENTLDSSKAHFKITLSMSFIITAHNPDEFKGTFDEYIVDIADNTAALSEFISDNIKECECEVQQLGTNVSVSSIQNKQAFEELSEYIKVTHETSNEYASRKNV